ncbi:uncharacterized protein LOC141902608 [Tubulanus polymorphus]|uniref:uncharacterized protein LOC141902608 n=1 Tax=Tubulanus polymorphus TaxID=672921 RepID=UPI003DA50432
MVSQVIAKSISMGRNAALPQQVSRVFSTCRLLNNPTSNVDTWKVHQNKTSLVIFDKDGTLLCYHSLWIPWARSLAKRLQDMTGMRVADKVYKTLGICSVTDKISPGLLTECSPEVIRSSLVNMLNQEGVHYTAAKNIVDTEWRTCNPENPKQLRTLDDLSTIFSTLHDYGVKTAVCTEDTRQGTVTALRTLGISQYVDKIVCGDDKTALPKPSPHNVLMICDALNVAPAETAIVGDRKVDMAMGIAANLGTRIGVLTGVGNVDDLTPYAHHIVGSVEEILPIVLPVLKSGDADAAHSPAPVMRDVDDEDRHPLVQKYGKKKWELVIFDKDGTLICFHSMWAPWAIEFARRMEKISQLKVSDKVLDVLGVDKVTETIKPGVFAEGTTGQVESRLADLLVEQGLSREDARSVVKQVQDMQQSDKHQKESLKSIGDTSDLFCLLKENGVKIAVCTADSRDSSTETLKRLGALQYVDMLVCGDDENTRPKPQPHNALKICKELGVEPADAIMVGDTKADMGMGRSAKLGATVGVLSGVASTRELRKHADIVVPTIEELVHLILPDLKDDNSDDTDNNTTKCVEDEQETPTPTPSPPSGYSPTNNDDRSRTAEARRLFSTSTHPVFYSHQHGRSYSTAAAATQVNKRQYKYIIVGAGSAGCVLANRLSADENNEVLVVEAGPEDDAWTIHMPAALMYNLCHDKFNWYYHTVPQPFMNDRSMYWPRGRVLGGSSCLNAMVYIRGHAFDYDRWEKEGAANWSYADCLPYFRKSQTHELGADEYRGGDGPLHVSRGRSKNPLFDAFIEAGQQAGYPYTDDMNGYQQEGFGRMDMTIHRGQRWSASMGYLRPVLYRKNLTTEVKALTKRILFEGNRAIGIEYEKNGRTEQVYSEEVILSGGAINSPQLLMLSGVGNADELKALDIPIVQHLPGVGENLQDHLEIYVQQECKQPITLYSAQWKFPHNMVNIGYEYFTRKTGDGASAHLEAGGFVRSRAGIAHPDVQYHFLPSTVNDHGRVMGDRHAYQVHVGPMRATSRGNLKLKSRDPADHPVIDPKYLSTDIDRWEMRNCVRLSLELHEQRAFDAYRGRLLNPNPSDLSDAAIDDYVRRYADSAYHPSCTCKMGDESDPMAVTDSETRVLGTQGLRVVDASIMPSVVSGNLNGPTIMVAEKSADIILGKSALPKSKVRVYVPKTLETQR